MLDDKSAKKGTFFRFFSFFELRPYLIIKTLFPDMYTNNIISFFEEREGCSPSRSWPVRFLRDGGSFPFHGSDSLSHTTVIS